MHQWYRSASWSVMKVLCFADWFWLCDFVSFINIYCSESMKRIFACRVGVNLKTIPQVKPPGVGCERRHRSEIGLTVTRDRTRKWEYKSEGTSVSISTNVQYQYISTSLLCYFLFATKNAIRWCVQERETGASCGSASRHRSRRARWARDGELIGTRGRRNTNRQTSQRQRKALEEENEEIG